MAGLGILINVGAKTDAAVKNLADVDKALKNQGDATKKASASWKKMAGVVGGLVAGAAVGDYLMDAAKAAASDAAETSKLNKVLDNNTSATQDQIDAASSWIDQMEIATTISDSDLRVALGKLTAQTGDLTEAQKATALAADIAVGKNVSLSSATKIVEKTLAGQTQTLKKQHPEWDKNADGILSSEEAMKGLGDAYGGAAEAAADPWAQIQTIFGQLKEQVGSFILPLLDKVKEWLNNPGNVQQLEDTLAAIGTTAKDMGEKIAAAIGWLIDNQGTVKAVVGVLGALAAVVGVVAAAQAVWAAAIAIWSAVTAIATGVGAAFGAVVAFLTSPIVLIVLAILALIAIVVLLWKNWDKVTKALGAAWAWLKAKAVAIFNALKDFLARVWQGIKDKVTAIWNGIIAWLKGIWESIKSTASSAFNALKSKLAEIWDGIKSTIKDKVAGLIDYVKELPGKILRAVGNLGHLLYNVGKDLIQGLINGIKSMLGGIGNLIKGAIPDWVPGIGKSAPATPLSAGAQAFMAGPKATPTVAAAPTRESTVIVTEEQIYRAVQRLILRGDARNGRVVMVG